MSFWSELKRRNVVKVGIAYAIVAWLLIQGADIIFPHLNLPSWAVTFLIVFLIIGFPLALLFAWAFEITPDGIKLTKEVPRAESITRLTGKKLNYILAGLLVLALAYILFNKYYLEPRIIATKQTPVVKDVEEASKTIAVLPFVNRSSEKDQEYFVDGLSDEIITMLSQISDLQVTSSTSSFTFKGSDKTIQEIAEVLGVAYILEGSVRKVSNALRITAQLIRAADDYHLWSEAYDRDLKDIFAVQEDIATAVAAELKITLGIGKSLKRLGGTDNVKAYEHYLFAQGQLQSGPFYMNLALKSIDAAIALDPEFALALALKAQIHNGMTMMMPANSVTLELDKCLQAVQRAIEIEPNLAEAYAVMGSYKVVKGDWIGAESAYRKALELKTEPYLKLGNYQHLLFAVGYFKKANKYLEVALQNDPLNNFIRGHYMISFGLLGDIQRVEEENQRNYALFGKDNWDVNNRSIIPFRLRSNELGSLDDVWFLLSSDDKLKERIETSKEALEELHRMVSNDDIPLGHLIFIPICAACLGDLDFSMDVTEKILGFNSSNINLIWYPIMREVRQMPRFKELVREIGLVDYWNKFGWPDICRPLDNGDFECD